MYGAQLIEALCRAAQQKPAELRSWTGESPVPTQAQTELLCRCFFIDNHFQMRGHIFVQLDRNDELADGLERFM